MKPKYSISIIIVIILCILLVPPWTIQKEDVFGSYSLSQGKQPVYTLKVESYLEFRPLFSSSSWSDATTRYTAKLNHSLLVIELLIAVVFFLVLLSRTPVNQNFEYSTLDVDGNTMERKSYNEQLTINN